MGKIIAIALLMSFSVGAMGSPDRFDSRASYMRQHQYDINRHIADEQRQYALEQEQRTYVNQQIERDRHRQEQEQRQRENDRQWNRSVNMIYGG